MLGARSLQQRMVLFLLLPVALLLTAMGWFGFWYARTALLAEWQEAAVLKLQRAAHQVDMRLSEPKFWMQMFQKTGGDPKADVIQQWILEQLDDLQGVEKAVLTSFDDAGDAIERGGSMWMRPHRHLWMAPWGSMMVFERAQITEVTPPRYDSQVGHETVSLVSGLLNAHDKKVGELRVAVRFDYLMENALSSGWGTGETASLINEQGRVLACNLSKGKSPICSDEETLHELNAAIREKPSGTIFGQSKSPREVLGFHRLQEAPWTLVLTARDTQILEPIYHFRNIFLVGGLLFIVFILLLIRMVAGNTVKEIGAVSRAARQVAKGDFRIQLGSAREDEVGQLVRSFNTMVTQLEEGIRLK
jgi:HAMP domain-containing protein